MAHALTLTASLAVLGLLWALRRRQGRSRALPAGFASDRPSGPLALRAHVAAWEGHRALDRAQQALTHLAAPAAHHA